MYSINNVKDTNKFNFSLDPKIYTYISSVS
jgi:hypothetical protein